MAIFKGFKPQGMQKIANKMGYQGGMENFDNYLEQNPNKKREMLAFEKKAVAMARGGVVRLQEGGVAKPTDGTQYITTPGFPSDGSQGNQGNVYADGTLVPSGAAGGQTQPRELSQEYVPPTASTAGKGIGDVAADRLTQPGLPTGAVVSPVGTEITDAQTIDSQEGMLSGDIVVDPTLADTTLADDVTTTDANLTEPVKSKEDVDSALDSVETAQTDENDPRAKVIAAEQTESAVGDLKAAQGKAIKMDNPVQREIQEGELIEGVANAEKAATYTEQIQAAEAQPSEKATVAGQLEERMADFEGGKTPPWAAGAMRGVMARMAARGMGASSMSGQAMVQAAMESALPIASADAKTIAGFEAQNLSNRQSRAMLAAEQRATFMGQEFDQAFQARVQNAAKVSDIANQNFTAEQQVALENSRNANSMNMANLTNNQALIMAEAAAVSNLEMGSLNNRQQASVQNAKNFLEMDMANLSNQQQTEIFKAQQRVQSLFSDQAAANASRQFNATSQNQTDQFFSNLKQQATQYNATQANAQAQFNAGQTNTIERFNAEVNNQRDQFNANNETVIAQHNAQWRRQVATADTVAVNRANELNASAVLGISKQSYDNLWTAYSDTMEMAWKSAESELDRIVTMAEAQLDAEARQYASDATGKSAAGKSIGNLITTLGGTYLKYSLGGEAALVG